MFKENEFISRVLSIGRKIIPRPVFNFFQPFYHWLLSFLGAMIYGFPSKSLTVICITGTKGKSTTVYMLGKIFDALNIPLATIGSLGFKIKNDEWPNELKMTMPGRMKLQKFLSESRKAGVKFVIIEATSEGIAQHRLAGIKVDCAVFTGLHKEHIDSHGSFENYIKAKQQLFIKTKGTHIINVDDKYFERFINIPSDNKITFGVASGDINQGKAALKLRLIGDFNVRNGLAALCVVRAYGLDFDKAREALANIESVPGRMEFIDKGQPFKVVIDYAHTPDSLETVYKTLGQTRTAGVGRKLICVLGAAGGGRDKWKRPEFGRIAQQYCDEIILTNEDPYNEAPEEIINQVYSGISQTQNPKPKTQKTLDRKDAIEKALRSAQGGDIVIITGKGSENSMAIGGDKKIPWSDKKQVESILERYYNQ